LEDDSQALYHHWSLEQQQRQETEEDHGYSNTAEITYMDQSTTHIGHTISGISTMVKDTI